MEKMIIKAGIVGLLSFVAVGCGSNSSDDDDSTSADTSISFTDFKAQCYHASDGDYWRFDVALDDQGHPENVSEVDMEVRPATGGDVLQDLGFSVTYNASPCWYYTMSTYQDNISCAACDSYGYKILAYDFQGHHAEKTFPGEKCTVTEGTPPDGWDSATPSPFCP